MLQFLAQAEQKLGKTFLKLGALRRLQISSAVRKPVSVDGSELLTVHRGNSAKQLRHEKEGYLRCHPNPGISDPGTEKGVKCLDIALIAS